MVANNSMVVVEEKAEDIPVIPIEENAANRQGTDSDWTIVPVD